MKNNRTRRCSQMLGGSNILGRLYRDTRGAIGPMFVFVLPLLLGALAYVTDLGHLISTRSHLQAVADATALAAASSPVDEDTGIARARYYAAINMPIADYGDVLPEDDILFGTWNGDTRTFTQGALPTDAVLVTLRRTEDNGNALDTFFGSVLGIHAFDVTAAAIATSLESGSGLESCLVSGFVAMGKVYSGSENTFDDSFCVHGEMGVKVGSTNFFDVDVEISMPNLSDLEEGSDNTGLDDAIEQRTLEAPDALRIDEILTDIQNGNLWPDYLDLGPIEVISLPESPVSGTLYYVTGDVDFGSGAAVENIGVIAEGAVTTGSNVTIRNTLLASFDKVEIGSDVVVGDGDYCDTGDGTVFLAGKNLVKTGSNVEMTGVQVITGDLGDLGSDLVGFTAVGIQASGEIKVGSQLELRGCPDGRDDHILTADGESVLTVRIVD